MENIPDKQKGFRIKGPDGSFSHVVLMNPFPILEDQVTIVSLHHQPQQITEKHIRFILNLTGRSERFQYSFNGIDAGASIPAHFHFYGFIGSLPIEAVSLSAPVMEISGTARRLIIGRMARISGVCPEFEIATTRSSGVIIPRSP